MSNWLPVIISVIVALAGSGGVLFGALRYNRDEAGKVVAQQTAVLTNMQSLNDELHEALNRAREDADTARGERDALRLTVETCTNEIHGLRSEIRRLHVLMEKSGLHGSD